MRAYDIDKMAGVWAAGRVLARGMNAGDAFVRSEGHVTSNIRLGFEPGHKLCPWCHSTKLSASIGLVIRVA